MATNIRGPIFVHGYMAADERPALSRNSPPHPTFCGLACVIHLILAPPDEDGLRRALARVRGPKPAEREEA